MAIQRGNLFVISGPSGVGKGTVIAWLLEQVPKIKKSVSVTTRKARPNEKEGIDYFFRTREEFLQMVDAKAFMEWAEFAQNFYGTPKQWVEDNLDNQIDVILEIDIAGAKQIHSLCPEAVLIFLSPPSLAVLEERLKKRATESADKLAWRLNKAKEEMSDKQMFQYEVVNDTIDQAVNNLKQIVYSKRVNDNCSSLPEGNRELKREIKPEQR